MGTLQNLSFCLHQYPYFRAQWILVSMIPRSAVGCGVTEGMQRKEDASGWIRTDLGRGWDDGGEWGLVNGFQKKLSTLPFIFYDSPLLAFGQEKFF